MWNFTFYKLQVRVESVLPLIHVTLFSWVFVNKLFLNHFCINATSLLTFHTVMRLAKCLCGLSIIGQSEDGADPDSPEEGTPASPRNKRRVGRPGRKRKQLLPVSTVITGWRQPFTLHTLQQHNDWLSIHLFNIPLSRLSRYVKPTCTVSRSSLFHTFAVTPANCWVANTVSSDFSVKLDTHIWVCLTDNVTKHLPPHSSFLWLLFLCFYVRHFFYQHNV